MTALILTDNKTDDASVLKELVADTFDQGIDINKVGADGPYDTYECWDTLVPAVPTKELLLPRRVD